MIPTCKSDIVAVSDNLSVNVCGAIPTCSSDIVAVSDSLLVIRLVRTSDAVAVSDKLRVNV